MRYLLTMFFLTASTVNIYAFSSKGGESKFDSQEVIEALIKEDVSQSQLISNQYFEQIRLISEDYREKAEKWKSDRRLLRHIFYSVHKKFLLDYKPYDSFEALMNQGTYGCLSATTLYALIFEELGFNYEIVELNFHIYLMVSIGDRQFLIESTDSIYGFISNKRLVEKKLLEYKEGNYADGTDKYNYEVSLNNKITLPELIGLQYYNESVQAFNSGDIYRTLEELNKAAAHYKSSRIAEFVNLIIDSVNEPEIAKTVISNFDELAGFIAVN